MHLHQISVSVASISEKLIGRSDMSLKQLMTEMTSAGIEKIPADISPLSEGNKVVARNEIVAKLISTVLGLAASFTITYFGVKWLVNAMDPTRKEKQQARERVIIIFKLICP